MIVGTFISVESKGHYCLWKDKDRHECFTKEKDTMDVR